MVDITRRLVARLRNRGITGTVGAMLVALVLILAGLVGYSALQETENLRSIAQLDAQDRSGDVAASIDAFLASTQAMLSALAAEPAAGNQDADALTPVLAALLRANSQYANIWATRADGWNYASPLPPPDGQQIYIGDRQYFQEAMETGKPAIRSVPDRRQHPTRFAVAMAYPVRDKDGKVTGTVNAGFEILPVQDLLAGVDLPANSIVTIVDENGYIVARSTGAQQWVGENITDTPLWQRMATENAGLFEGSEVSIDGSGTDLIGYTGTRLAPWKVIVSTPSSSVYPRLWGDMLHQLAILAVPALAAAYLALRLGRTAIEKSQANELIRQQQASLQEMAGALESERDILQTIMENTHTHLAYLDPQFNFVRVNSAYARRCNHDREALLGRNHFELFPNAENEAIFKRVRDTGEAVEFHAKPFEYADQPWRGITYWDWTLVPVKDDGRVQGLVFSLLDVTGQVRIAQERERLTNQLINVNQRLIMANLQAKEQAEEARRQAAEMDTTIASIADAVLIYGPTGEIVQMNPAAERVLGYSSRERTLPYAERMALLRIEMADGKPFPMEELPGARALHGETVQGVLLVLHVPGGKSLWVSSSAGPICSPDGELLGAVVTFTDVTVMHELQEQREEFMRMISHDLRNPLTVMVGQAQLLQRQLRKRGYEQEVRNAEAIMKSGHRMNSMITDLVESARLQSGRLELREAPTDLCQLVADVAERVGTLEDRARLRVETQEGVPLVLADPDRIERAIVNLITNALKYSSPEAPVTVRVEGNKDGVIVSVADHGVGIPAEDIPFIFDRFYRARTGKQTEGLGLGLYITRLIVEAHGGHIWLDSELDKGSTFYISLCAVDNRQSLLAEGAPPTVEG